MAIISKALRFPSLLWARIVHEWHMRRYGWHYTEKPMLGKPLFAVETKYSIRPYTPKEVSKMILFKRSKND